MSQPNQSPSPFEGNRAINFQDELLRENYFDIKQASRIADQTFTYAYPEVLAQIQSEIIASHLPQPEQTDYSQPLYVVPAAYGAIEATRNEPQSGENLNPDAIRAQIENIHDNSEGFSDAA